MTAIVCFGLNVFNGDLEADTILGLSQFKHKISLSIYFVFEYTWYLIIDKLYCSTYGDTLNNPCYFIMKIFGKCEKKFCIMYLFE